MSDTAPALKPISKEEEARRAKARDDRTVVMSWLRKVDAAFQRGFVLMTREPTLHIWEQTGFLVRKGTEFCIKVGPHPYQPIGQIDDEFFYPTQASLLVWGREFAMVEPTLIKPAFETKPLTQADLYDPNNPSALSDREREALTKGFEAMKTGIVGLAALLDEGDSTKIGEAQFRLLEDIKLIAIASRVFDDRIRRFAVDNPELATKDELTGVVNGFDFSQNTIKPLDLAKLFSEFIRLKLNDDAARRYVVSNELVAAEKVEPYGDVLDATRAGLMELMPKEGAAFNASAAQRAISSARVVIPDLEPALKPFVNSTDMVGVLRVAIEALRLLRARIPGVTVTAEAIPPANDPSADVVATEAVPNVATTEVAPGTAAGSEVTELASGIATGSEVTGISTTGAEPVTTGEAAPADQPPTA